MAKKRKKYLVTTNSEAFACSLVTSPAMEETFVAFNEEKPFIEKFSDNKKHLVTGVVAIPNKPIYRRNADGDEYDIVFSSEAIEKMAKDFMKDYRQHEVTLQHQDNADGVYLVEQWIKNDMVYDKSIAVGLSRELPIGSWIQTYYVDSKDVWDRIESGELQGFSLECMLGLEEFEKQIDNNMTIETNEMFWDKFKKILKEAFGEKKGEDNIEPIAIEDLAAASGFTNVEDYEKEKAAVIAELEEQKAGEEKPVEETPKAEEKPAEEVEETPKVEDKPAEETPKAEEEKPEETAITPDIAKLEELIGNLKNEINALKTMNSGLEEKVKEMSKEPSAKPIPAHSKASAGDTYKNWREQMRTMIG